MADSLSAVATLCLAILHRGEATGYEIKKESVEGDYRYYIDASYGSIYPALARLAADDLVTVREETHPGRPARKIYAITEKGRAALLGALCEPPGPDVFRARFLLVAKFARELPAGVLCAAITARKTHLRAEIAHLDALESQAANDPAIHWVVNYGKTCMTASLEYLEAHGDALLAICTPPLADAAE